MSDVVVKKNTSGNTFLVNNEIEEVLSAGSADNLKIQKITDNSNSIDPRIQDKIELSSNKDIGIGLELLANKEKTVKREGSEKAESEHLEPLDLNAGGEENITNDNVINLDKNDDDDNITFNDPTTDLVNQLNIDDRTSRLSQNAIDAIIDKNDSAAKPNLVDINDIETTQEPLIDRGVFGPADDHSQDNSHDDRVTQDNDRSG